MKTYVFKIIDLSTAIYIKDYDNQPLEKSEVLVSFVNTKFKDTLKLDDGDFHCLLILEYEGKLPKITR